jgi:hypothetical protein
MMIEETNPMFVGARLSRRAAAAVAIAASSLTLVVALVAASPAFGLYGDEYGAAPINDHPDAIQDAPAIPGDHAFWAGACNRSQDPGIGADLAAAGNQTGFGVRPGFVIAADALPGGQKPRLADDDAGLPATLAQKPIPAPQSVDHCLDVGATTLYELDKQAYARGGGLLQNGRIWQQFPYDTGEPHSSGGTIGQELTGDLLPSDCVFPPDASYTPPVPPYPDEWAAFPEHCDGAPRWRLPAETRAGARADGSSMLAWSRNREAGGVKEGEVEGSVDNIHVDLPPGFVGNPQAVPMCTGVQFREKPLRCPPESQVGVLRLNLEGLPIGTAQNLPGNWDTTLPVYNLEPREGNVAELGVPYAGTVAAIRIVAKARTNGDFGVSAFVGQIPAALVPLAQEITLWGVPWAPENDLWRTAYPAWGEEAPEDCMRAPQASVPVEYIPPNGMPDGCAAAWDPSWGEIKPFLTNETDCNPAPTVRLATDSFQHQGAYTAEGDPDLPPPPALLTGAAAELSGWKTYESVSPAVTDCEDLDFEPELSLTPTSASADGATGLHAELAVPQNNSPRDGAGDPLDDPEAPGYRDAAAQYWDSDAGRATAHLKDSVVTLPAGVSVNPSAATGLAACTDAQIGMRPGRDAYSNRHLFNNGDPFNKDGGADGAECPDASKIGTAEVNVPLLAEPLTGEVVLGQPKSTDPQSGEMFRLFIVVRLPERGLVAKIYGSTKADPANGQLLTTFENNPEVPFDDLSLDIKGGPKGMLALPPTCGTPGWTSTFSSWASVGAQSPVPADNDNGAFAVGANCSHGFGPALDAGMSTRAARRNGAFKFKFSRPEGQQYLRGLTATLPKGLLASVKDFQLCTNAQAAAGACPLASQIGIVDAKAGSGDPFVLEEKGRLYLTEGYKGGEYGLAVEIHPIAGPFRGGVALSPIIVRQAIHVDRRSAQVTAISDPFPLIHHGVPLRVREVTVLVDRARFMLNPSGCEAKQVGASILSDSGTTANLSNLFQTSGCAALPFKPRLQLRLTGRRQVRTGRHPGIRAVVRQRGIPEAGIEKAVVRLPKSLALDVNNAQALCEFEVGTKPDLENHCPDGSIVGRARAISPLLDQPLVGNVYFVKNVRIDPDTGNEIRTLPMIIVALRGEISINLRGESNTTKAGKLVNTFDDVPDAPVSRFNLNIKGGKDGILAVTRTRRAMINLCKRPRSHVAEADMDGHNGKRRDFNVRMKTPCGKKKTAKQRRRAAAKRKQARRNVAKQPARR